MPDASETAQAPTGHKPWLFTPESAKAASLKAQEARKARIPSSLGAYVPLSPAVSDEAARELLPRILSDEIAWRSELLATVRTAETALLDAIKREIYDASKQTLPQIVASLVKVVDLSDRLVEKTKKLDLSGAGTDQVSGLFAKAVIVRRELVRRGIMTADGQWRVPEAKGEATASEAAASVDASAASESAPPAGAEGVS